MKVKELIGLLEKYDGDVEIGSLTNITEADRRAFTYLLMEVCTEDSFERVKQIWQRLGERDNLIYTSYLYELRDSHSLCWKDSVGKIVGMAQAYPNDALTVYLEFKPQYILRSYSLMYQDYEVIL